MSSITLIIKFDAFNQIKQAFKHNSGINIEINQQFYKIVYSTISNVCRYNNNTKTLIIGEFLANEQSNEIFSRHSDELSIIKQIVDKVNLKYKRTLSINNIKKGIQRKNSDINNSLKIAKHSIQRRLSIISEEYGF